MLSKRLTMQAKRGGRMRLNADSYFTLRTIETIQRNEMGMLKAMSEKQDKQIAILEHLVELLEQREDEGSNADNR